MPINTPEIQNIIDRVRKCLALGDADRNPNEHEAKTAIDMAKKLMQMHNLSMADVAERDGALSGKIIKEGLNPRSGLPRWESNLSRVCDYLFGTRSYISCGYQKDTVTFVGFEPDVALSLEVYKLLKLELLALARQFETKDRANPAPDYNYDSGEETTFDWPNATPAQIRTRKFVYLDGVVQTLSNRSWTDWDEVKTAQDKRTRDLVIVPKEAQVRSWMEENLNLSPSRSRGTSLHGGASDQGRKDGHSVNLNFKNKISTDSKGNKLTLDYKGGK